MKAQVVLTGSYEIRDEQLMEFYGTDDVDKALAMDKENFADDPGLVLSVADLEVVSVERVA